MVKFICGACNGEFEWDWINYNDGVKIEIQSVRPPPSGCIWVCDTCYDSPISTPLRIKYIRGQGKEEISERPGQSQNSAQVIGQGMAKSAIEHWEGLWE